jgi:hypothetical protein
MHIDEKYMSIVVGIIIVWLSFLIHSSLNDKQTSFEKCSLKDDIITAMNTGESFSFRIGNYSFFGLKDRDNE